MVKAKKFLSKRDYARHKGVSHTSVNKAANAGRITTTPDGLIDPEDADRQWEQNTDPTKPLNSVTVIPNTERAMTRRNHAPTFRRAANRGSAQRRRLWLSARG